MMDDGRQSHSPVVPENPPNNARERAAEVGEERGLAKGNSPERIASRTQRRTNAPSALERVRQVRRHDSRQEPDAVVPLVRVRGGLRLESS
jgi:RNA-directed DNA polymerase